jgi:barbiturase
MVVMTGIVHTIAAVGGKARGERLWSTARCSDGEGALMAIVARKVVLEGVQDASGMARLIDDGVFAADEVIAVIGKTEGNGGVNDFTRILADQAFRGVLVERGSRDRDEVEQIPMVWSGGCDGVITPHATVFARTPAQGGDGSRLAVGIAMSAPILPEDIGRPAMVSKVADGVREAMKVAGITDPAEVHYVQTKTPLLTMETISEAKSRGQTVFSEDIHQSMDMSNGTTGLGVAVGLGEIAMPDADAIGADLSLYSSVASCSSGVELDRAQIVLVGNAPGAGGDLRIGHGVMSDALDFDGIYNAIRSAGLDLPDRPHPSDLGDRLVNVFLKCEADPSGRLRGRRQIMLDDSDVHWHRHSKAAVGGVTAAAVGDPAVFVSVGALHQGPPGGGPVAAIVRVD